MARQKVMETHDFYCLNCGNKNMPLARKRSHYMKRIIEKDYIVIIVKKK